MAENVGAAELTKQDLKAFGTFLEARKIVIADGAATIRATIARALTELGAKQSDMTLASSFGDAVQAVRKVAPDFIFAEYHLENHCGLELILELRKARRDMDKTLFFLVTGNSTEAAIAEAA